MSYLPKTRNAWCVFRDQHCGYIYGYSETAFIACTDPDGVAMELRVIRDALEVRGIEPYVSVESHQPARDVHCEKVCSKIIQSKFCVAILTPIELNRLSVPSANVYFEFGLMCGFSKKIIPMLRESTLPPFNVQSLDTVKYNEENISGRFEQALAATLASVRDVEGRSMAVGTPMRSLSLYMEQRGHWYKNFSPITAGTHVKAYSDWKFGTVIRGQPDVEELIAQIRLMKTRIGNVLNKKTQELKNLENEIVRIATNSPRSVPQLSAKVMKLSEEIERIRTDAELVVVCPNSNELRLHLEERISHLNTPPLPVTILSHADLNERIQIDGERLALSKNYDR